MLDPNAPVVDKYPIKEEHYKYYDYLEKLRRSGVTNMWGATPYLKQAFSAELTGEEASQILCAWINHYDELNKLRGWIR